MARPHVDGIAQVVALRQLRGNALPLHRQIAEPVGAIDALHRTTRPWPAFAPRLAAVDEAIVQAEAIARSLRELRLALAADQQGGPADAA